MVGNKIIVKRPGSSMTLATAGLSILSDCDCNTSSFNPVLFTLPGAAFASATTLTVKSTDAAVNITLNMQMRDAVSSVCGNTDGFTKCGPREIIYKDKMTGKLITFPYKGFVLNAASSVLTLNPAQASAICVLTATLK
jgi:hypothetical protein